MAPILSFTATEIWEHMPKKSGSTPSIFMSHMPVPEKGLIDETRAQRWEQIFKERSDLLKALEEARSRSIIGHSLDAKVIFHVTDGAPLPALAGLFQSDPQKAADILIVSQGEVVRERPDSPLSIAMQRASDVQTLDDKLLYKSQLLNCCIEVAKADGQKCDRCWKYSEDVGKNPAHPTVCARCARVLTGAAS
jgi:isoleucyl-tRNA synthetase